MATERHIEHLRHVLHRCRQRVEYCERDLARFDAGDDGRNPRARQNLADDLRKAKEDAGWAAFALDEAETKPQEKSR